jgi:hydrogenase nickel incorporation protein HypB
MRKTVKIIEIDRNLSAENDAIVKQIREENSRRHRFLVNMMASPGAGKTSVLLKTAEALGGRFRLGVMEADIAAQVDAEKMQEAGLKAVQVHTGGECAMDAAMTAQGLAAFGDTPLDLVSLENVGNLVCPAENDVGADLNVAILSVPEGDDKPLKYPLMFRVCPVVLINKIDTEPVFAFDRKAVCARILALRPDANIFFMSAKTGAGVQAWADWLTAQVEKKI